LQFSLQQLIEMVPLPCLENPPYVFMKGFHDWIQFCPARANQTLRYPINIEEHCSVHLFLIVFIVSNGEYNAIISTNAALKPQLETSKNLGESDVI
jgi:hypothetical protein